MRRALYWTAVVVAVAALTAGAAYAYVGYRATAGPDGAVRGYFAALSRGDAPAALAFGDTPDGARGMLTDEVLAEQQQLAPLRDVRITEVTHSGDEAIVRFSYVLGFPTGADTVHSAVRVVHTGSGWRLSRTAVATTVQLTQATDRLTFAGTTVPDGTVLLFPGALPVRFDTPYLRVDPTTAAVQFGGGPTTEVSVEPTPAARTLLTHRLRARLADCVSAAHPAAACPLPSPAFVPGSLHGRVLASGSSITVQVRSQAAGTIELSGNVTFTGRWRRLAYDNVVQSRRGRLTLPVDAVAYPVAPLALHFAEQS